MTYEIISKVETGIHNRENYYNVRVTNIEGLSWFTQIEILK